MMNMTTGTMGGQMAMMGHTPMQPMYQPMPAMQVTHMQPMPQREPVYPSHISQPTHQKCSLPSY